MATTVYSLPTTSGTYASYPSGTNNTLPHFTGSDVVLDMFGYSLTAAHISDGSTPVWVIGTTSATVLMTNSSVFATNGSYGLYIDAPTASALIGQGSSLYGSVGGLGISSATVLDLTNAGLIAGGTAALASLGGLRLNNSGIITADEGIVVSSHTAVITNSGVIAASGIAIDLTATQNFNSIVNSGSISGTVKLGNWGNYFSTTTAVHGIVSGGNSDDTFVGGTGADTFAGGTGNDVYDIGSEASGVDDIREDANGGMDSIKSSISRSLADFDSTIEGIILTGTRATTATGTAGANVLDGTVDPAANVLRGLGGNDTYFVLGNDVVDESARGSGGIDTVVTTGASVNLADTAHYMGSVENVTFTGDFAGLLIGNKLNNTLTADGDLNSQVTMRGGAGNDTYVIKDGIVTVDESVAGSGGTDTVIVSRGYSINGATTQAVENLTLTADGTATGNAKANIIDTSATADANTARGMGGNDTYIIGSGDTVDETGGGGTDTVESTDTIDLSDTAHYIGAIENATLLGNIGHDVIGNDLSNVLTGNSAADVLTGHGGKDYFVFNTLANADMITDFSPADDTIRLENAIFKALTKTGTLASKYFHADASGHAASSADQHIIYDHSNGTLWYDSDGKGSHAAVEFALLDGTPSITAADFAVI